jgi:hypothetical protein
MKYFNLRIIPAKLSRNAKQHHVAVSLLQLTNSTNMFYSVLFSHLHHHTDIKQRQNKTV